MPDGNVAQRGGPRGRGIPRVPRTPRVPRRAPRGIVPVRRFPRPIHRRRFPRFFVPPVFIGFPRQRCFWIDPLGRCCDRYGYCCDRYGRCEYVGDRYYPVAGAMSHVDSWYGVPGGWDMMPDMDDDMQGYDDMVDYDMDLGYDEDD